MSRLWVFSLQITAGQGHPFGLSSRSPLPCCPHRAQLFNRKLLPFRLDLFLKGLSRACSFLWIGRQGQESGSRSLPCWCIPQWDLGHCRWCPTSMAGWETSDMHSSLHLVSTGLGQTKYRLSYPSCLSICIQYSHWIHLLRHRWDSRYFLLQESSSAYLGSLRGSQKIYGNYRDVLRFAVGRSRSYCKNTSLYLCIAFPDPQYLSHA